MSKLSNIHSGPRIREEIKRTYYCEKDRRQKAATIRLIRYTDGRQFRDIRFHNGHNRETLYRELGQYMREILCVDFKG